VAVALLNHWVVAASVTLVSTDGVGAAEPVVGGVVCGVGRCGAGRGAAAVAGDATTAEVGGFRIRSAAFKLTPATVLPA
jgi:hypothetical protein